MTIDRREGEKLSEALHRAHPGMGRGPTALANLADDLDARLARLEPLLPLLEHPWFKEILTRPGSAVADARSANALQPGTAQPEPGRINDRLNCPDCGFVPCERHRGKPAPAEGETAETVWELLNRVRDMGSAGETMIRYPFVTLQQAIKKRDGAIRADERRKWEAEREAEYEETLRIRDRLRLRAENAEAEAAEATALLVKTPWRARAESAETCIAALKTERNDLLKCNADLQSALAIADEEVADEKARVAAALKLADEFDRGDCMNGGLFLESLRTALGAK